ncbi:hypothetical protein HUT19_33445 [Streptomyces sp. NA02950]|uniref:hypothetical protein n=1 Tax=Streptomyces sp. NA02950 TaxID=2742137 RepID=UPI001590C0DA|nr:hypothetical protein [Streptomyces sp. NA02950]QKV96029.1 hypothetical protein HUT19_33445 [Streptomyces sp. NA02950]
MEDDVPSVADVAEVARAVHEDDGVVTVMVGSADQAGHHAHDYSARLGDLLDSLRDKGVSCVRLVMSGAGDDQPDRPCLARRIADAWEMEVIAPDGAVLIAPGGALFVQGNPGPARGWWRFAPGTPPRPLGLRAPVPEWQGALGRVPARTAGGCVVDQIPAGIHMRPAEASQLRGDDLCFAMPVHPERPVLLVGALQAEDVPADEVAAVLAALPAAQRSRVQLAPGGRRDLLPLAQSVADMLDSDVEVLTGMPLLPGNALADATARPTLVGAGGEPTWQPYVTAVACGPTGEDGTTPEPRPLHSHPLNPGRTGTEDGTLPLTGRWYAVATRAGVAVGAQDGPAPSRSEVPVDPDTLSVELGTPGTALDDSVLPALSRLLDSLGPQSVARSTLLVRGTLSTGETELRRLSSAQGVSALRYLTGGPLSASSRSRPDPVAAEAVGRPHPDAEQPDAEQPVPAAVAPPAGDRAPATVPTASSTTGAVPRHQPGHRQRESEATRDLSPTRGPEPSGAPVGTGGSERPGAPAIAGAGRGGGGLATAAGTAAAAEGAGGRTPGRTAGAAGTTSPGAGRQEPVRTPAAPAHGAGTSRAEDPERAEGPGTDSQKITGVLTAGSGRPPSSGDDSSPLRSASAPGGDPPTSGLSAAGVDEGANRGSADRGDANGSKANRGNANRGDANRGSADRDDRDAPGSSGKRTAAAQQPPVREPAATASASPPPPPPLSGVPVPLVPGHVSSDAERAAFRELASDVWEIHGATVSRILTRMPALRGQELEAARADLVALIAYLTTEEGPLLPRALVRDLHLGEGRLLPYAACIASALRRLPSYRGMALRGGDAAQPAEAEPRAGALLLEPGPVSSLALSSARPGGAPVRYAIWSVTGRKVRQLLDRPAGAKNAPEEVVFAPGTAFRVLGSQTVHGSPVILLRELPGPATPQASSPDGVEELGQLDRAALGRLEAALGQRFTTEQGGDWPERCTGPLGSGG